MIGEYIPSPQVAKVAKVADLLIDIEHELHELQLWQAEPIASAALRSQVPFAVDTMSFPQWLQFIFLPRMQVLIEQQQALPINSAIAPMAEQYFVQQALPSAALVAYLQQLDALLTRVA